MIILNLQEGFDITGLETSWGDGWHTRALVLEKKLTVESDAEGGG